MTKNSAAIWKVKCPIPRWKVKEQKPRWKVKIQNQGAASLYTCCRVARSRSRLCDPDTVELHVASGNGAGIGPGDASATAAGDDAGFPQLSPIKSAAGSSGARSPSRLCAPDTVELLVANGNAAGVGPGDASAADAGDDAGSPASVGPGDASAGMSGQMQLQMQSWTGRRISCNCRCCSRQWECNGRRTGLHQLIPPAFAC